MSPIFDGTSAAWDGLFGRAATSIFGCASDGIHHAQQRRGQFRVELELAVAQPTQQVLAHVGNLFQFVEAQKSAGALDGVNRAKHAAQRIAVLGILLQPDQFPVQPVQVLVTLHQELFYDFAVALAHGCRPFPDRK
jgi:hypothetical protein